jgi:hypothetical protein
MLGTEVSSKISWHIRRVRLHRRKAIAGKTSTDIACLLGLTARGVYNIYGKAIERRFDANVLPIEKTNGHLCRHSMALFDSSGLQEDHVRDGCQIVAQQDLGSPRTRDVLVVA